MEKKNTRKFYVGIKTYAEGDKEGPDVNGIKSDVFRAKLHTASAATCGGEKGPKNILHLKSKYINRGSQASSQAMWCPQSCGSGFGS